MIPLKEQISRKCIHFNGVMSKECEVGIKYSEVRVDELNKPYKFPCLKQGGECSCAQFPSDEEVEAKIRSIEDEGVKAMIAMVTVKDHYKKTKEQTGKVSCQCGGELHYTRANVNGHFWVKCNTCGISFNE